MGKRRITQKPKTLPTEHKEVKELLDQSDIKESEKYTDKWKNRKYSEKKAKGRSISMHDDFYAKVKEFLKDKPEFGGSVSKLTVVALAKYMRSYEEL